MILNVGSNDYTIIGASQATISFNHLFIINWVYLRIAHQTKHTVCSRTSKANQHFLFGIMFWWHYLFSWKYLPFCIQEGLFSNNSVKLYKRGTLFVRAIIVVFGLPFSLHTQEMLLFSLLWIVWCKLGKFNGTDELLKSKCFAI